MKLINNARRIHTTAAHRATLNRGKAKSEEKTEKKKHNNNDDNNKVQKVSYLRALY